MQDILFYGGIILMGFSVLAAVISSLVFRLKTKKLNQLFDALYGKPLKERGRN